MHSTTARKGTAMRIDFEDLTLLLSNWNQDVPAVRGNIVNPATTPVNFDDLTALLAVWSRPGRGPAAATGVASSIVAPQRSDAVFAELGSQVRRDADGRVHRPLARRATGRPSNH